jgi:hypothetical protein
MKWKPHKSLPNLMSGKLVLPKIRSGKLPYNFQRILEAYLTYYLLKR